MAYPSVAKVAMTPGRGSPTPHTTSTPYNSLSLEACLLAWRGNTNFQKTPKMWKSHHQHMEGKKYCRTIPGGGGGRGEGTNYIPVFYQSCTSHAPVMHQSSTSHVPEMLQNAVGFAATVLMTLFSEQNRSENGTAWLMNTKIAAIV